jgi:hypothetical protein
MKVGDRFIRYSNHESTIKGVVDKMWVTYSYDLVNRVRVEKPMIQSDAGRVFEARECLVIESDISFKFWLKLKRIFQK